MHFSSLLSTGLGAGVTNTTFLVAIAVLACILGAEIAGICILISKMLRARKQKAERELEENQSSYGNYAGLLLLFGAIPQSTYIALSVLAALAALFAVVFVVLLAIFRACGYDFASLGWYREEQARQRAAEDAAALPAESEEDGNDYTQVLDAEEAQQQEALVALTNAEQAEPAEIHIPLHER